MNKQYVGQDFSRGAVVVGKMMAATVDEAADLHMPLCMKVCVYDRVCWIYS